MQQKVDPHYKTAPGWFPQEKISLYPTVPRGHQRLTAPLWDPKTLLHTPWRQGHPSPMEAPHPKILPHIPEHQGITPCHSIPKGPCPTAHRVDPTGLWDDQSLTAPRDTLNPDSSTKTSLGFTAPSGAPQSCPIPQGEGAPQLLKEP